MLTSGLGGRAPLVLVLLLLLGCAAYAKETATPMYTFPFTADGKAIRLEVYPLFAKGQGLDFLDHRVTPQGNTLLGHQGRDRYLLYSTDLGQTWTQIPNSLRLRSLMPFGPAFITDASDILYPAEKIELLDLHGNVLSTVPGARYCWHGNMGVGQRGSTIIFAEYATYSDAREQQVFRSADAGQTWRVVFRQAASKAARPQIDHFHLCQPDPYFPGHW